MGDQSQGGRGSGCKCNFVKAEEPNSRGNEYIECTKCGSVVEGKKIITFAEIQKEADKERKAELLKRFYALSDHLD